MSGLAVMENVRRYRAIASLCRQAATFRPIQRISLLTQAEEWERRAVVEIEGYFGALNGCGSEMGGPSQLSSDFPGPI
ncbi:MULTISPECIES: hypothetical protein [unclassified Bradyrhizobium]|uniref:hypothetical protein n=1 Tax=unclassified Bradyrhizobium TaxID=2631580 RepID=UPI00209D175E|nr:MULTISPECIES: hypothetical protein [unclassified Bradyrhizobium]